MPTNPAAFYRNTHPETTAMHLGRGFELAEAQSEKQTRTRGRFRGGLLGETDERSTQADQGQQVLTCCHGKWWTTGTSRSGIVRTCSSRRDDEFRVATIKFCAPGQVKRRLGKPVAAQVKKKSSELLADTFEVEFLGPERPDGTRDMVKQRAS